MPVTKLKKSTYRHAATGFVVHEVWNLDGALAANGLLFESSTTGAWVWYAGRDLQDLIIATGATTLEDLKVMAGEIYFSGRFVRNNSTGVTNPSRAQAVPTAWVFKAAAGLPSVYDRVFGLITGLDAGFGQNTTGLAYAGNAPTSVIGASASYVYSLGSVYGHRELDGDIVGGGLVALTSAYTWSEHMDQFYSSLPYYTKPEVAAKIASAKSLVRRYMVEVARVNPDKLAKFSAYVILRRSGAMQYVPPASMSRVAPPANAELGATRWYLTRRHGARAYMNSGRGVTLPVGQAITATNGLGSNRNLPQDVTVQATTTADELIHLNGYRRYSHIDGVRIERILGGASGLRLGVDGEMSQDPFNNSNLTTTDVFKDYINSIVYSSTAVAPRPKDASGNPISDAEWVERETANWDSVSEMTWTDERFSTYDTHGFGFGLFFALCAMGMEPNKAKRQTIAVFEHSRLPPLWDGVLTAAGSVGDTFLANEAAFGGLSQTAVPVGLQGPVFPTGA